MKIINLDNEKKDKLKQLLHVERSYDENSFEMLYDKSQNVLKEYIDSLNFDEIRDESMQFLFFTSGTTGRPTGAYKSKANLDLEIEDLKRVLSFKKIKRVVATVPFVHLYGVNVGFLLSRALDAKLLLKENFLLEELIEQALIADTLVVTTPLFIKALNRLNKDVTFKNSLFVTSTSPLMREDAKEFNDKYGASILQIFGSTETGAIAYKFDDETTWRAFESVKIGSHNGMLNITSPFISQKVLNEKIETLSQPFQSEDIVEILSDQEFRLIGRSSSLVKISGKRLSTSQLEEIVQSIEEVKNVMIKLRRDEKALKDEILDIYVEPAEEFQSKMIKEAFLKSFGSIHIPYKVHLVNNIIFSSVGKKVGFE